ncbi:MAG: NUDIX domain-containing protein [Phycisphaeraceae bacterium]
MDRDHSCGIIPVYGGANGEPRRYLLVQHKAGHWGFPKGHPETGESELETALRELGEETGLAPERVLEATPFAERYVFRKRSGKVVDKTVTYFVGFVRSRSFQVQEEELQAAAWGDVEETVGRMSFEEGRRLLREVDAYLDRDGGEVRQVG